MPATLADVLATADDFDLCDRLFQMLLAHHEEVFNPARIPPEHAAVLLVWLTAGVVGSQGFNGLFASGLLVDPDYRHTQAAYAAVGCEPAAAAVRRVFDAFPGRVPPADLHARVQAFGKANHAVHGALNRDFIKARDELTAALAKYIRDHAAAFAGADTPRDGTARPAARPAREVDRAEAGCADLPRWACVAYHARCARQVLHLWEGAWPEAPADYHDTVEQAIVLAELCAAEGKPVGDLKTTAARVAHVAEAAVDPTTDPPPPEPTRAGLIAAAAGSTLDLILGLDGGGSYPIVKVLAQELGDDDLMDDLQEDFQRVRQLARDGDWTDATPVPPDVFEPGYKPKKSWWKKW